MAFLDDTFDVENLPKSDTYEPLPPGWYDAAVSGADLKTTKAGNGQYVKVQWDVLGPTHQGRMVFDLLNIRNPNIKAEEIGRQQLGNLMRAIGIKRITDTDELLGGRCQIKLKITKSEEWGDQNNVTGYKALVDTKAPDPSNGKTSPPWAKK